MNNSSIYRPEKLLVVKSNRLVNAIYRLSLVEQRILLVAIARCREHQRGITVDCLVTVSAFDLALMFNADIDEMYRQLKKVAETLNSRLVTMIDDFGEATEILWVSQVEYIRGSMQIVLSPSLILYITRLRREFTSYDLSDVVGMTSTYAIRMYELIVQYKTIGERTFELSDLRRILGLASEYPSVTDFRRYVVDIAVDQINTYSNIEVLCDWKKSGKSVTHLTFNMKAKKV